MRTLAFIGVFASLLFGGCASYQMGEPSELPYKRIAVSPPRNLSTLPQLEGPLNAALRQAILQSGALALETSATPDAILDLAVLEIRRDIAAVTPEDVGRGRKFELVTELELTLREPGANGRIFIDSRKFSIKTDTFTDDGQVDAEYQAVPEISRKIATRVAEILVDVW